MPRLRRRDQCQPVLLLHICRIDPRVMHIHMHAVVAQFRHHIHDTRIAQVGAVFLEGQPQDQDARTITWTRRFSMALTN